MEVPEDFKELDLYAVLHIDKSATANDIKKAYRRRALQTHPDKGTTDATEFHKVAFAFSVLSNEKQRKSYDKNGLVTDINDELEAAFSRFSDFEITPEMIAKDRKLYREEEERQDTLRWYQEYKGDFDKVFANVLHTEHGDEDRIRGYIDEATKSGEINVTATYKKTTTKKMDTKRKRTALREARAAERAREELGISTKTDADLAALIKKRQSSNDDFLDQLAAKYT